MNVRNPIHEIIKEALLKNGWQENADGSVSHPFEEKLKSSSLELLRRKIRLDGRPQR
ncbi:MAG: hypothetical protein QF732_03240 [Nitrospinaceae bacterium]|nr:hypothetical protein [Nitrospinaceae bacterium]